MISNRPEKPFRTRLRYLPYYVFGFALAYLGLAWLISYLGDVHNFLGLTDRLINRGAERPFMWYYLFMEGSPTEWLQWCYLGATVLMSGILGGQLAAKRQWLPARFFTLLGVGTTIMLMEDAGNLRHQIKYYIRLIFGDTMRLGIAVELVFYGLLGLFLLYILVRYARVIWQQRTTRRFLLFGYGAYALAALASATRHIADWYDHFGNWLLQIAGLYELMNARFIPTNVPRPIGFYIMDFLVEESIELMAASALLAGVVAYFVAYQRDPKIARVDLKTMR